DQAGQPGLRRLQVSDALPQVADLLHGQRPDRVTRVRAAAEEVQQRLDLGQREPEFLGPLDEADPSQTRPAGRSRSGSRWRNGPARPATLAARSSATSEDSPPPAPRARSFAPGGTEPCTPLQGKATRVRADDRKHRLTRADRPGSATTARRGSDGSRAR